MFVFEQDKKLKINTVDNDPSKANIIIESTEDGKAKITMDGQELGHGGGAVVVNFVRDGGNFSADKTIEEVKEAMKMNPVIGTLKVVSNGAVLFEGGIGCATVDDESNPAFGCYYANSTWFKQVGVDNDEWAFAIES